MVPAAFVVAGGPAPDPQRQGGPQGPPRPRPGRRAVRGAAVTRPAPRRRTSWPRIWAEVLRLERVGDPRQLLRPRRRLDPQHPGGGAGQPGRPAPDAPPALRAPDRGRPGRRSPASAPAVEAEQGPVSGPVPLTPIQRWFFEQRLAEPAPLQPGRCCSRCARRIDAAAPRAALWSRSWCTTTPCACASPRRPVRPGAGRSAVREVGGPVPFERVDLSALPADEQGRRRDEAARRGAAGEPRPRAGPLLRAALFDLGPEPLGAPAAGDPPPGGRRRLLAHPAGGPPGGLRPAGRRRGGAPARSRPPPSSQWAAAPGAGTPRDGGGPGRAGLLAGGASAPASPLPVDLPAPGGGRTAASTSTPGQRRRWRSPWTPDETRALLQDVPAAYRTRINDVLLTALAQAFAAGPASARLLVDLEGPRARGRGRGRRPLAHRGLVHRPLPGAPRRCRKARGRARVPGDCAAVKEQLRAVPRNGIGYGLLRYLSGRRRPRCEALPAPQVSFNYLGQFDQAAPRAFALPPGQRVRRSPRRPRRGPQPHPGDQRQRGRGPAAPGVDLQRGPAPPGDRGGPGADLPAPPERPHRALPLSPGRGFTPSDFPLAGLDQETVDRSVRGRPGGGGRLPPDPDAAGPALPHPARARGPSSTSCN